MADVFYFRGTRTCKYRPSSRGKTAVLRKRQLPKMDVRSQHACVARFDEPIFCSNDSSAWVSSLLRVSPPTDAHVRPGPTRVDSDEDVSEGGVQLLSSELEEPLLNPLPLPDDSRHPAAQPAILLPIQTRPLPSTVLRSTHPRPSSPESWQEEDGRRQRFALEGFDTRNVPQFAVPTQSEDNESQLPSRVPQQNSGAGGYRGLHLIDAAVRDLLTTSDLPLTSRYGGLYVTSPRYGDIRMDQDALPVDDVRRSYDFADFMDSWRILSLMIERTQDLPMFAFGKKTSDRLGGVLGSGMKFEGSASDDSSHDPPDLQGIDWRAKGPARQDALRARAVLHPSRRQPTFNTPLPDPEPDLLGIEVPQQYHFRIHLPNHRAHLSHYQLRNVLAASGRNNVLYATGSQVHQASLPSPSHDKTVMDLSKSAISAASIRITCLATSPAPTFPSHRIDNILIAGGFCGEYALLNLHADATSRPHEGFVTHAWNGLITHIHTFPDRRSGQLQAAFCSNNQTLRILDTSTLRFTQTFAYDAALNCSATSPDGRLRALVADSLDTLITDAEKGCTLIKLRAHRDHAFACAWSPSGQQLATGAQDGQVVVWDARNWAAPLQQLPSLIFCPRAVQYTADGTLVVAEQDDVVRIYDGRDFSAARRQDLRFFGSVAGMALLDGGAELVIANADRTVGGLLAFRRSGQGRNGGTFGVRMESGGRFQRDWQWSRQGEEAWDFDGDRGLFV